MVMAKIDSAWKGPCSPGTAPPPTQIIGKISRREFFPNVSEPFWLTFSIPRSFGFLVGSCFRGLMWPCKGRWTDWVVSWNLCLQQLSLTEGWEGFLGFLGGVVFLIRECEGACMERGCSHSLHESQATLCINAIPDQSGYGRDGCFLSILQHEQGVSANGV